MDKTFQPSKEQLTVREQVWLQVWCATVNANDCKTPETAQKYADIALTQFDEKFRP